MEWPIMAVTTTRPLALCPFQLPAGKEVGDDRSSLEHLLLLPLPPLLKVHFSVHSGVSGFRLLNQSKGSLSVGKYHKIKIFKPHLLPSSNKWEKWTATSETSVASIKYDFRKLCTIWNLSIFVKNGNTEIYNFIKLKCITWCHQLYVCSEI